VLKALHVCGDVGHNAFAGNTGGCIDFPHGSDVLDRFDYSRALARSLDKGVALSFYYGKVGGWQRGRTSSSWSFSLALATHARMHARTHQRSR
jgi:hypothetical protein